MDSLTRTRCKDHNTMIEKRYRTFFNQPSKHSLNVRVTTTTWNFFRQQWCTPVCRDHNDGILSRLYAKKQNTTSTTTVPRTSNVESASANNDENRFEIRHHREHLHKLRRAEIMREQRRNQKLLTMRTAMRRQGTQQSTSKVIMLLLLCVSG